MRLFSLEIIFAFTGYIVAIPMAPLAPLLSADDAVPIEHQYIVVLKNSNEMATSGGPLSTESVLETHQTWLTSILDEDPDSSLLHVYNMENIQGYSGIFSERTLSKIRMNEMVEFVERDQVMGIDWNMRINLDNNNDMLLDVLDEITGNNSSENNDNGNDNKKHHHHKKPRKPKPSPKPPVEHIEVQPNAPWGLSRVSSRNLPTDLTKFSYPSSAGQNVDVYVIDTGINVDHSDFEGRAIWGKTIPKFDQDIDGNGHGTHVAGTIASKTFGIAKKAKVIAVKVLRTSGYGSNADVIAGVDWVIQAHNEAVAKDGKKKSVANMSLGGGRSPALDRAVNTAVTSGVHFAVAAGNDSADACNYSPAGAEKPMTVGASNIKDDMAYFSNHGSCVDIFAPGMDITSTWIGSNVATNTISGTSMASPHVAGVMALYLGGENGMNYSTSELKELMIKQASKDMLKGLPVNTENSLLSISSLLEKRQK